MPAPTENSSRLPGLPGSPTSAAGSAANDFAARFCRHHGVALVAYQEVALRHALYPQARWFAPWLGRLFPDFSAADREFVDRVGRIMDRSEFAHEAEEFTHHPANRRWLRRTLRLRASVGRMRRVLAEVFGALPEATARGPGTDPVPPLPFTGISPGA